VAITTDVIAGFPGETETEFEESYGFCEEMGFAGMHVFPYSQRSGTVGFKLPDQVTEDVKKQRVHRLIELARDMGTEYRGRYVGSVAEVLWERRREDGAWEGLTDTYLRVRAESPNDLTNRIVPALVTAVEDDRLLAEVTP
jgi:threonylcarbamoyladenosine tRNA methylthiotransferase MtaB